MEPDQTPRSAGLFDSLEVPLRGFCEECLLHINKLWGQVYSLIADLLVSCEEIIWIKLNSSLT